MTDNCTPSAADPPASRGAVAGTSPASRSRVANGSATLYGIDGRSKRGRRYRDILDGFVVAYDATDEVDLALCRGGALLALSIEDLAAKLVTDESADVTVAARLTVRLQRALGALAARQKARRRVAR